MCSQALVNLTQSNIANATHLGLNSVEHTMMSCNS